MLNWTVQGGGGAPLSGHVTFQLTNQGDQMPVSVDPGRTGNSLPLSTFSQMTLRWKINSLCSFRISRCSKKHSSGLRKKKKKSNTRFPSFPCSLLQYDVAIFISFLQPSCCFMLTWRMVWKSQLRRVNPRGTCLLSFLEHIKCHELQWGVGVRDISPMEAMRTFLTFKWWEAEDQTSSLSASTKCVHVRTRG